MRRIAEPPRSQSLALSKRGQANLSVCCNARGDAFSLGGDQKRTSQDVAKWTIAVIENAVSRSAGRPPSQYLLASKPATCSGVIGCCWT